jgi:ABC-type oligopeptide transport system substrate-binding subunit
MALMAACYAESSAPYAPVAQIIRLVFANGGETLAKAGLGLSEDTLDALGMLAPDCCGDPRALRDRPELDPQADQERLFDGLIELFQALTRRRPLLVLFEDVHWADSGTLALVRRLSRRLAEMPLLLALTYREFELGESRALSDLLYEISRQRLGERIKLTRLSRQETAELLAAMFADQPAPEFVDLIYRETEGNPFFIEEVCKSLIDEGRLSHQSGHWQASSLPELRIPQSVRMAIEARVERLPAAAQEALRLAAVFGREFDFTALQAVASGNGSALQSEEDLIDALEAAQRAQLITETPPAALRRSPVGRPLPSRPSFSFTHALIPSALLDEMSTMRRQRLHRRAGLALERLSAERPLDYPKDQLAPQLSRHFIEAGDHAKALDYLLQVGDRARQLFAYPEAIEAYEQAQEYLKEQGDYETAARTLMKLGLVYHLAYDFPRSRQAYQQGFSLWQQAAARPGIAAPIPPAARPFRAAGDDPRSFDPARVGDVGTAEFTFALFEGLAELTHEMDILPAIASSWEVQQGGRRYLFRLRRDVRWSDGEPLTAHDFVFAWRRTLHPATASPNASLLYDLRGARRFHSGENPDPALLGVSASDNWTLLVELEEPVGYFMYIMAHYAAFPLPRHRLEALGDDWATPQQLVCNGPFRLAGWQPGKTLTLERNPHYTGRFSGNLQAVEFDLVYDRDRFQARYEADELDVVGLGTRHLEQMRYRYPGEYLTSPEPGSSFIGFNLTHPPLNDRRVRQALVHALDRAALVELLSYGYPMPTSGGFLPPGIPGHAAENGLAYDPERARQLLAEAGYPGGRGFPELNLFALKTKQANRMGEFIARAWKEVLGVELHLREHDLIGDFNTLELPGLWHITWMADYPDADNFLRVALEHYQVLRSWKNAEFNQLVDKARRCLDPGRRAQMYRDADRLLTQDAVLMPLSYMRQHLLVKPWVKNFRPGMLHFFFFKDVILDG